MQENFTVLEKEVNDTFDLKQCEEMKEKSLSCFVYSFPFLKTAVFSRRCGMLVLFMECHLCCSEASPLLSHR